MDRISAWTQSLGLNREGLSSAINFVKNVALLNVAGDLDSPLSDDLVKITDNIYSMGFPSPDAAPSNGFVSMSAVSNYLRANFPSKFMIWNLSDRTYDYSQFDDQVIEFKIPGYTTPPLDKIFPICRSIDGWLHGDPNNVAVIHCISGRGRTTVTIACYLTWIGAFPSTQEALEYVLSVQNGIQQLIPSQERYLKYFDRILAGDYPLGEPLHLDRIIINTLPIVETDGSCRPYIQLFKYGKLLKSTASKPAEITSYKSRDSVSFPIELDIDGDILIRLRHFATNGTRVSLLRFTFHTGYIKNYSFRCTKADLDGAFKDDRFSPEFHIDLMFSEAKTAKSVVNPDFFQQISKRQVTVLDAQAAFGAKSSDADNHEKHDQSDLPHDVDALISDLGIDGDIDILDDDTDQLLAQLQEEIQGENAAPDQHQDAIERKQETELDAEINELLASS